MLTIRFQRMGRRNQPFYRLVVAEHSAPVKGKFTELVGHYNPLSTPKILEFKKDRIAYWTSVGATPSQTVARLLAKNGVREMEKYIEKRVTKPSNKELEAKKAKEEAAAAKKAEMEAAEAKANEPVAEVAEAETPAVSESDTAGEAPVAEVEASANEETTEKTPTPDETPEAPIEEAASSEEPPEEKAE